MTLKCLRQGHLSNMDLNPGLWLTLNYIVNQIIELVDHQINLVNLNYHIILMLFLSAQALPRF